MSPQETIPPGESERFEAYAAELRAIQRRRAKGREHFRALHTKPHVGAVGTLEVAELPEALRVGPFAEAKKTWPVYVRFSNGQGGYHSDSGPDVRGMALKLVGVPGKKLIPGLEGALTQDFLFIQTPSVAVKGPDEFIAVVRSGEGSRLGLLPRLIRGVGVRRSFAILRAFLKMPKVRSLATAPFYTATPLSFGATACKLALFPEASDEGQAAKSADGLRAEIVARLASGPLAWSLKVQRYVDEATTPIEDVSVRWPEDKTPWEPLARLTLPRQDVTSAAGRAVEELVHGLSFDPWHALPELRPLGAMMRARAPAYRESVLERKALPEPESVLPPG